MRNRLADLAAVGVVVTLWLSPSTVLAQNTETSLPLPSIGLPLPSIGLPHPPMGLPPVETRTSEPATPRRERSGDRNGNDGGANDGGRREPRRRPAGPVVFYPPLLYVPPPTAPAAAGTSVGAPKPGVPARDEGMGRLVVDVTPAAAAQLYVDGYYVGTPADYPDGIEMTAGPHTFEVRVPGEEPISTSVQIAAGRAITYRAAPIPPPATTPAVTEPVVTEPVSRTPFYLIPGCYLGNIPPDRDNVPAGCDLSQVRTIRP